MTTANAVTDDAKMSNERLGAFTRRTDELKKRINQGVVGYDWVMDQLQRVIEGLEVMRNPFNPHTYFKTCDGLYVLDTFEEHILVKQPTVMPCRGLNGVTNSTLPRNMSDQEIIDEILGGMDEARAHASTLDQIAEMIDFQPNGKDGKLLNNGYANVFYVLVDGVLLAVRVNWNFDYHQWLVSAWHLGEDGEWFAGIRVFRNTTLVV